MNYINETTYECKFILDGIIKELFFRAGETAQKVREGLEIFDFGEGSWTITEAE